MDELDIEIALEQERARALRLKAAKTSTPTGDAEIRRNSSLAESLGSLFEQFSLIPSETTKDETGTIQEVRSPFEEAEKKALTQAAKSTAATGTRLGANIGGFMAGPEGILAKSITGSGLEEIAGNINQALGLEVPQTLPEQAVNFAKNTALNYAFGKAGEFLSPAANKAKAANDLAMRDYLQEESSQAALRAAQNAPEGSLLRHPDKLTSNTEEAMRRTQAAANNPESMAIELGYPQSVNSGREKAATKALDDQAPNIYDTGIFENGGKIDPYSGVGGEVNQFTSGGKPPTTLKEAQQRIGQAQTELMTERRTIIDKLDNAMESVNNKSKDELGKIRGISFTKDIAPRLKSLRDTIAKRKKYLGTEPQGNVMENELRTLEQSTNRIISKTEGYKSMYRYPGSTPELGEMGLKDTADILEDINTLRRQYKEFDESVKAAGMNSTFSDVTGHGATLEALTEMHHALNDALAEKAGEVIAKAKNLPGAFRWQDTISKLDPQSIKRINNTYRALEPLEEALYDAAHTSKALRTAPRPGSLIGEIQQGQSKDAMVPITKAGMWKRLGDWIGERVASLRDLPTEGLERSRAFEAANTQPLENLRDLSLLRRSPIGPPPNPGPIPNGTGLAAVTTAQLGRKYYSPPQATAEEIASQMGQQVFGQQVPPYLSKTSAQLPRSPELVLTHPELSAYLKSQVSPDTADVLNDAFNRKDPLAMEAAMSVAMAERPDLFEKSITGLASEMVRGGDIVLTNPAEGQMYLSTISSLYHQGKLNANFLAAQAKELNTPTHMKVLPRPDLQQPPPDELGANQSPMEKLAMSSSY